MSGLLNKLHDEHGVSLIYALMFLLVAVMAVSIMLSASLVAINSVKDDQKREQDSLTLSSAANVVAESLKQTSFRVDTEYIITTEEDLETGAVTTKMTPSGNPTVSPTGGTLVGALSEAMASASGAKTGSATDKPGSFQVKADNDELSDVITVDYVLRHKEDKVATYEDWEPIAGGYTFECSLTIADNSQRLYLVASRGATVAEKTAIVEEDGIKTMSVSDLINWSDAVISTQPLLSESESSNA